MSEVLFSIIVPIYNVEEYIFECIESILDQDFKDFELIAVDDGSKDNCGKIIDEYAKKDSRIKVIHKENGGLVNARKSGLHMAVGTYVLNVDGDDYLEPGALKVIADICLDTNADIVCYSAYRSCKSFKKEINFWVKEGFYNTNKATQTLQSKILYVDEAPFYTPGIYPTLCCKAIKKNLYAKYQLKADSSVSMGEDLMVSLPALLESGSVYVLKKPLYNYRVNDNSITQKYKPREFDDLLRIIKAIKSSVNINNKNIMSQFDVYVYYRLYSIYMSEFIHNKSYAKVKRKLKEYSDKVNEYISGEYNKYKNKKYRFIKFVIKHKFWLYFWINSLRIKRKK